ncbi:MAG TPA: mechanosensitive ion channel family protein [Nitrososphaera sp.]|nr:mechanosensitive ion channel family protein [Nitrososphaera sp.]
MLTIQALFGIPDTINVLGTEVELLRIVITIVVIAAGFGFARFFRILTTRYIGTKLPPETRNNLGKLSYYVIIAIALLSALGVSGLDLSGIFLGAGIAGIVIGFATQSLFSNLISGIFLYIDKPMKIGDPVLITGKLPDIAAVVVEINTLSTRFRMFDGTYVRLPNTEVFSSEIRNFSGTVARRVEIQVRIALQEDAKRAIEIIGKSLSETPLVLVEPAPDVYVNDIGESGVNINVWCWVPSTHWFQMRKQLVEQVKAELDRNGIEIPLPHRRIQLHGGSEGKDNKSVDGSIEEIGYDTKLQR